MVLENLDCPFRRIPAMIAGRCELIGDVVGVHFIFYHVRYFVVQSLETRVKTSAFEEVEQVAVGTEDLKFC